MINGIFLKSAGLPWISTVHIKLWKKQEKLLGRKKRKKAEKKRMKQGG